ncbi:MAG: hypothetical protein H6815_07920 [Phycisphaeraceae bacterium]|nr:hypothetical protein [Phycisphaerales bacterium]MCB9860368.1 hypothetical protein [Phycisphaeraceae bacterium]
MKHVYVGILLAGFAATSADGAVIGVNNAILISPPANVGLGSGPGGSGQFAKVWNEQQGVSISSLMVDMIGNPTNSYVATTGAVTGTVDSHMIHHTPGWINSTSLVGSVTFDGPIVGVIFSFQRLNQTDAIFAPTGTTYSTANIRGFTPFVSGAFVNGNTLNFDLFRSQFPLADYDQLRVLTQSVPSVGTTAPLVLAGMMGAVRRRQTVKAG